MRARTRPSARERCDAPWDKAPPVCGKRGSWRAFREEVRFYYGAHLHRRLFLVFGVAIFLTVVTMEVVARWRDPNAALRMHSNPWLLIVPPIVLWVASGKIARRIARPLYELAQVSKDIGEGNLQARARLGRGGFDEIAMLSRSVNDMASRIERQLADQRELLAGVSHELRTPLARLRVLMEIVRERGASSGTLDDMETEIVEIDSLVGELLANARLDFQSIETRRLSVRDVAERALLRAGEAGAKLRMEMADVNIEADPTLLSRALANLLDNAQKHGRGLVTLRVHAEEEGVAFEIADQGPGFGPRLNESGEHQPRAEGSLGLGLVLVRRIAKAHGGRLALRTAEAGGGGRAVLWLPGAAGPREE